MKRVFQPTQKKTILIVDDDPYFLEALQDKFERHGCKVESLRSPDRLLEKLGQERVDCLLIDLCLPGLNGVEILKEVRAQFAGEALPIVAFSNVLVGGLARAAAEISATRCFAKTESSPDQLWAVVRQLLAPPSQVAGPDIIASETPSAPAEPAFQGKLRDAFSVQAPETLAALLTICQAFARPGDDAARRAALAEMHPHCRSLAGISGPLGFKKIAQMANALEALCIEVRAKPQKITPSVIRTILEATDTLRSLFAQSGSPDADVSAPSSILVVDDEVISRETICSALRKASLGVLSLDDPVAAGLLLQKERFDLIFLDVEMPVQNGLDLCASLRRTEANRTTPVVFVTAHSDFASWARTSLSGGNDFIAKPFLSVELAVKALSWLFRKPAQNSPGPTLRQAVPLTPRTVEADPLLPAPA